LPCIERVREARDARSMQERACLQYMNIKVQIEVSTAEHRAREARDTADD
jgi:hypothetical protein